MTIDVRPDEAKRLTQAREKRFKTAKDATNFHGWNYDTYAQHENGIRGIRPLVAAKYAKAFRVTTAWLLTGTNEGPPVTLVPEISWVSAGRLREVAPVPLDDLPLLAFTDLGRGDFFALTVKGDSMDRISPEGSKIIVNREDKLLVTGKAYVFSVRGETTYKLWEGEEPQRLEPYSLNPSNKPIFVDDDDMEVIGRVRRTMFDL